MNTPLDQVQNATRDRSSRGFTLIELVTTMSIIAVAAAVAVPRFTSSMGRYHLENSARRLAADIDTMRQRASMLSSNQVIMFAEDGYKVMQRDGSGIPTARVVEFSEEPYRATLKWIIMDGSSDLVFDQYGLPRAGGVIRIESGGRTRLIQVAGASGRSDVTHEMSETAITGMMSLTPGTMHNLAGKRAKTLTEGETMELPPDLET